MKFIPKKVTSLSFAGGAISLPKSYAEAEIMMKKFVKLAEKNGAYGIDTETSGLCWFKDKLLMVSMYTPGMSLVLDTAWSESSISVGDLAGLLRQLTRNKKIHAYLHNAKFDMHFLMNHGIRFLNEIHDTCLMGFIIDATKPNKLKLRAKTDLELPMKEFKDEFPLGGKKKLTLLDYPVTKVAPYAALDAFATYGLAEKFFDRGPQPDKFKHTGRLAVDDVEVVMHYDRVDSRMVKILFDMERRGICVDRKKLRQKRKELKPLIENLEKEIIEEAGVAFNMRSPKQVTEVFASRGITMESTDEKHLKHVARIDNLASLMLKHREHSKILSTYVDAMEELLDENNSVHTSYNLHIAGTGRLSSSNPNAQNWPRDQWYREWFIPRPGCVLICKDYSQIELRVLAVVSEDKVMLQEYMDGVDIHRNNAAKMFSKRPEDVTEEERNAAKQGLSFGVIYGMSARALAELIGISEAQAEHLILSVFAKYKGVDVWIKRIHQSAKQFGYVKNLFGRKMPLPDVRSSDRGKQNYGLRKAQNYPIQGGAADFVKMAMIEIDNDPEFDDLGGKLLLQVHDELVVEAPIENADEAEKRMGYLMSNFPIAKRMPIPFTTEGGWSAKNWWNAKKAKKGGCGD